MSNKLSAYREVYDYLERLLGITHIHTRHFDTPPSHEYHQNNDFHKEIRLMNDFVDSCDDKELAAHEDGNSKEREWYEDGMTAKGTPPHCEGPSLMGGNEICCQVEAMCRAAVMRLDDMRKPWHWGHRKEDELRKRFESLVEALGRHFMALGWSMSAANG